MILLTDQERQKFSMWLREQVESNKGLLKQMEKLSKGFMASELEKRIKMKMTAYIIIAIDLEGTESVSISEEDVGDNT